MTPKLSVVVISYNMARELPRTLLTLSPAYQLDVAAGDYEVILIDNGSTQPFDDARYRELLPNLIIHRMSDPGPSPVPAVNLGLQMAKGELVCVCIDGARMLSPRLLAMAMRASGLHPRAVVGALAFHLGPDVQAQSMRDGYDQAVEDDLLATVDWKADGYSLFEISVLATSSKRGWFIAPTEANALLLSASHWRELGGYDARFQTPGGGLANLDVWARACGNPEAQPILLLGEATFHQFHGGVATNAAPSPRAMFQDEYLRIRGEPFAMPVLEPWVFGRPIRRIAASLEHSASILANRKGAP